MADDTEGQDLERLEDDEGLPAERAAPAGESPDSNAERLSQLESELAESQRLREEAEGRLRDTQSWANQQNMARLAAERALQAVQPAEQPKDDPAPPELPQLTADERSRLLDDPEALERRMLEVARYGYSLAMHNAGQEFRRMTPILMAAHENAVTVEGMLPHVQEIAVGKARKAAETQGIAPEDFDRLLPAAHDLIVTAAAQDRTKYRNMTTNADAIVMAVTAARSQNGVPVVKPRTPPTIGTGQPAARQPAPPVRRSEAAAEVERKLGIKFTDEELRAFGRDTRRQAGA